MSSSLSFRPVSRPTQPSLQWLPVLSMDVKRPARGADTTSPISIAEATNGLELFLRLPYVLAQACYGVTITTKLPLGLADIPSPSGFLKKNLYTSLVSPRRHSFPSSL